MNLKNTFVYYKIVLYLSYPSFLHILFPKSQTFMYFCFSVDLKNSAPGFLHTSIENPPQWSIISHGLPSPKPVPQYY